jgi:4-hydroxy-3-polyprenylbenzoate decarboxylase
VGPVKRHGWGEPLRRSPELESQVDRRWAELGLADLGGADPDPALFGYSFERVLERLGALGPRPA